MLALSALFSLRELVDRNEPCLWSHFFVETRIWSTIGVREVFEMGFVAKQN